MSQRNHGEPGVIQVRYECRCPQTGKLIRPGDQAVHFPKAHKVYSLSSEAAKQFLARQFAESIGR